MILARRKFLMGLGALLAAPAIVSVANIMPVKAMPAELEVFDAVYVRAEGYQSLSEIVQTTLRNRSGKLAGNMMKNNALLTRLSAWEEAEDKRMFGDLRADIMNALVTA